MDSTEFDHPTRAVAAATTRRTLTRMLATLPIIGASGVLVEEASARRQRHAVQAEKKKTFCLNGQTIEIKGTKKKLKKKVKKLRKQGATPGPCSPPPTCTWTNQTTFGGSDLGDPHGVAMTPDGLTALVAGNNNNRISVWTRPNASSTGWSIQTTFGLGELGTPHGVAVTPDGLTALVADTSNDRISVWTRPNATSPTWSNQTTFGTQGSGNDNFSAPYDVAVTLDGLTALVADTNNDRISVWTRPNATSPTWSNQTTFGSTGSGPSNLNDPHDVALTADALTALVADTLNHRISVWTRPNATSPTWSNQTTFGSTGSGPSNFEYPRGIAVTPDGQTAVVSDVGNDRMSVWALTCTT